MSRDSLLELARTLAREHDLPDADLKRLLSRRNEEVSAYLKEQAALQCRTFYKGQVFIRGLIEISSFCKNDCYYCGIRCSNKKAQRYRLTQEEILECCRHGYALGFRTFVLQGGEDPWFHDGRMTAITAAIRQEFPDCAITLSLGERSRESYQRLFDSGADRYLLRHETASPEHYHLLHPDSMSFSNRMECLKNLRSIGYQTGCGFMVGSPGQTVDHLTADLRFIKTFRPHMVGIGPFLSHRDTPFARESNGSTELTLFLLSVIRLLLPRVLLPATTALDTAQKDGREAGICCGANVIMPNLSPASVREKYQLYDNKLCTGKEAAESISLLKESMESIGFSISADRGDSLIDQEHPTK